MIALRFLMSFANKVLQGGVLSASFPPAGLAHPQGDMGRLHRLLDDVEQVLTQLTQVDLIA